MAGGLELALTTKGAFLADEDRETADCTGRPSSCRPERRAWAAMDRSLLLLSCRTLRSVVSACGSGGGEGRTRRGAEKYVTARREGAPGKSKPRAVVAGGDEAASAGPLAARRVAGTMG